MTEFTPFFDGSNQLNYLKFVKCIILHIFVY